MFKRILIPVDPARPFAAANEYAVELAKKFESSIVATYVIDEQLMGGHVGDQAAGALDDALEWVGRDAMDDFAKHHEDLAVAKTLIYGPTHTAIFQMVLQTGADLVVVGGYHSATQPHLWGSTVLDIVQHDERPTFVVRKAAHIPHEGDTIVVPFDGSQRPLENLMKVTRLAKGVGASIDLVFVARKRHMVQAEQMLKKGRLLVEEQGVAATIHVLGAGLLRAKGRVILDHAKKQNAPLIAVSRLGQSSIHTGRSRTVAWLVAHSDVPVWVVRR